jgi:hypothetical protein
MTTPPDHSFYPFSHPLARMYGNNPDIGTIKEAVSGAHGSFDPPLNALPSWRALRQCLKRLQAM